jgi:hypothetical protein
MARRLVNIMDEPRTEFDPIQQVRFRGKALPDLSREEMLEALVQSLREVYTLKTRG